MGVQDLLNNPNPESPAQSDAYHDYVFVGFFFFRPASFMLFSGSQNRKVYESKVAEQAKRFAPV